MENEIKVKCGHHDGGFGMFWFAAWLFTIGFLKVTFWKGVLALLVWPYYLGVYFAAAKAISS